MGRYRKIDPRFWRDEKTRRLTLEEKAVALYILTAQSNRIGLFVFSPALAAEELDMPAGTFLKRFRNVCQTLNWRFHEPSRTVWIPRWWRYNPPENPNNVVGNLRDLDDLPETPLFPLFSAHLDDFDPAHPNLRETFTRTLAKRYPQRGGTQEQEQEQEKNPPVSPPVTGGTKISRLRLTPWPDGFVLSERMRTLAVRNGLDAEWEFGRFEDHHRAKGSRFASWEHAWRTWCKTAVAFAAARSSR